DAAGRAAGQARSAVSTSRHGAEDAIGRAHDAAGNTSAGANGAAEGTAAGAMNAARQTPTGSDTRSAGVAGALGADASGDASRQASANPRGTDEPSGGETAGKQGLLSRASSASQGNDGKSIDLSGSGAADGDAAAHSNSGANASSGASGRGNARAGVHGSSRHGVSTTAHADGDAGFDANAQH
ncbi:MAG: hypothetical protein HOQ10_15495, partial [Frateuria sp.]|nr:hypothetical protein [Frateuria sp.]